MLHLHVSSTLTMDSTLFPDSPALRRIINHHSKDALIDIVQEWLSIYPISRIDVEEDELDQQMDPDDDGGMVRSTRLWSLSKYKKHVEKQYNSLRDKGQKKRVVDRMLTIEWNMGLNVRQVAELDLRYYMQHAHLKSWKAMRLEFDDPEGSRFHLDPSKIEKSLTFHLAPYFKHHVQVRQEQEMVWIRISIHDGLRPNILPAPPMIVYIIWFANSEYLLSGTIKAEWKEYILEAVMRLFKASEIDEWPLTGRSPSSLAELLLQRDSQGAHSRYRLNQLDDNPLASTPKKRKPEDLHHKYAKNIPSSDIQAEDMSTIVRRDRFLQKEFGPNPQPSLQKVDLQLNLPFTSDSEGFRLGQLSRQPFPIKVVFEGSNVIEGVKNLIPLGIASNPMPSYLTDIHSMATSSLTVDLDEDRQLRVSIG